MLNRIHNHVPTLFGVALVLIAFNMVVIVLRFLGMQKGIAIYVAVVMLSGISYIVFQRWTADTSQRLFVLFNQLLDVLFLIRRAVLIRLNIRPMIIKSLPTKTFVVGEQVKLTHGYIHWYRAAHGGSKSPIFAEGASVEITGYMPYYNLIHFRASGTYEQGFAPLRYLNQEHLQQEANS